MGTFAASHNLYDRLTQKKKDSNQDDAIKKLEDKFAEMSKKKEGEADKKDVLKDELDKSGQMVKREYDVAYDRLGRRFAAGDSECTLNRRRFLVALVLCSDPVR